VSAITILQLIERPPAKIHSGKICFENKDLLTLTEKEMRSVRGRQISMVFQEPMTSLNPVLSIGFQIKEVLRLHQSLTYKDAIEKSIDLLRLVGVSSPERRITEYPHQLSGGIRQRAMIAMALACSPMVLIADEPTTALDVTIQAQVLDLMISLQNKLGTSILLITHDLGVIAEMANRVAVMYAGNIVEEADVKTIFQNPLHPYTQGLLKSIPRINKDIRRSRLVEIPGIVPDLSEIREGCRFFERCPKKKERCNLEEPQLKQIGKNHLVRCSEY
jgi:oligopeptide/dipeptide ABC transporter ATP-binding protein